MTAAPILAALLAQPAPLAQETGPGEGFRTPLAVAVAADGTAYVADRDLPGVWKVKPSDDGPVEPALLKAVPRRFKRPLDAPRCVAVAADGSVLVGDTATREVYRLDPAADDPAIEPLLTAPGEVGPIGMPSALAVAADGSIFVGDLETQRIYRVPAGGLAEAGGEPEEIARLPGVRGLTFGPGGGDLFAVTSDADQVRRLKKTDDGWKMTVAVAGRPFGFGHHVAAGPDGTLYVADNYERCVWKVAPDGDEGGGFADPVRLTGGGAGPAGPAAPGDRLVGPVGLAWDAAHDPPRLLVADPKAKKLFAVDPATGEVSVVAE